MLTLICQHTSNSWRRIKMGKKQIDEDVMDINLDIEEIKNTPSVRIEPAVSKISRKDVYSGVSAAENADELVSCLRNEKVIVRYIVKPNTSISNQRHVLYGGMAETASRTFTVPLLKSGALVNVLTDAEKNFLEYYMGLEKNALSIYSKTNNFWRNKSVRLLKTDTYLDLRVPDDYIKYKILLANKDFICPSLEELNNRRKATYQFVLINEGDEIRQTNQNMSTSMEASLELGKILNNKPVLKFVTEVLSGRPISKQSTLDYIQGQSFVEMQANPKLFITVVKDVNLKTKVLISECVENGIIKKRGDYYYLASNSEALCEANGEPTITNAAKYLDSPKHQELKFTLEAKLKAVKE